MKIRLESNDQSILQQFTDIIHKHWRFFLLEGIFFILLGISAMIVPHAFTLGIAILLGWLLLVGGILQTLRALMISPLPGSMIWLLLGVLQIIVGYLLISDPTKGGLSLTLLMTLFFFFEGLFKIILALMIRPLKNWRWLFFSGFTAFVLALVVWIGWPQTGYWVLGLIVGINMFLLGIILIRISLDHRHNFFDDPQL